MSQRLINRIRCANSVRNPEGDDGRPPCSFSSSILLWIKKLLATSEENITSGRDASEFPLAVSEEAALVISEHSRWFMTNPEDIDLRQKVIEELDREPSVDASQIRIAVRDGIVTITGTVRSYPERKNAEKAARHVAGVRAVAENLEIKLFGTAERRDFDIAQSALINLRFNASIPSDGIQVLVENGWITLDGEVEWQSQKTAAGYAVQYLLGVRNITNRIAVKPKLSSGDVKSKSRTRLRTARNSAASRSRAT